MRARSLDVGLATQPWPEWTLDTLKAAGIGAAFAAVGGFAAMLLVRRFRRHWWAPGALLVVAFGVVTIWLYPGGDRSGLQRLRAAPPGPGAR